MNGGISKIELKESYTCTLSLSAHASRISKIELKVHPYQTTQLECPNVPPRISKIELKGS